MLKEKILNLLKSRKFQVLILIAIVMLVAWYFLSEVNINIQKKYSIEDLKAELEEGKLPLIMITDNNGEIQRYPAIQYFIGVMQNHETRINKLESEKE